MNKQNKMHGLWTPDKGAKHFKALFLTAYKQKMLSKSANKIMKMHRHIKRQHTICPPISSTTGTLRKPLR